MGLFWMVVGIFWVVGSLTIIWVFNFGVGWYILDDRERWSIYFGQCWVVLGLFWAVMGGRWFI